MGRASRPDYWNVWARDGREFGKIKVNFFRDADSSAQSVHRTFVGLLWSGQTRRKEKSGGAEIAEKTPAFCLKQGLLDLSPRSPRLRVQLLLFVKTGGPTIFQCTPAQRHSRPVSRRLVSWAWISV